MGVSQSFDYCSRPATTQEQMIGVDPLMMKLEQSGSRPDPKGQNQHFSWQDERKSAREAIDALTSRRDDDNP